MQRNIIYILLFILFCQCTSAIRKDIKWIAITDIYGEFGIDSYDEAVRKVLWIAFF